MTRHRTSAFVIGACTIAMTAGAVLGLSARQAEFSPDMLLRAIAPAFFTAADSDGDGAVTRQELRASLEQLRRRAGGTDTVSITSAQLGSAINTAILGQLMAPPGPQNETPTPASLRAMMAALPARAPATPARPRKVLVLGKAAGFVHSSIPLAAKTVEALGTRTGAWTTTITYSPADITTANLQQYDAIFLASTTGCFLDEPGDPAATNARRAALLAFVRGGKGLAAIHAATDSYHSPCPNDAAAPAPAPAAAGRSGGGGGAFGLDALLAGPITKQADANHDDRISAAEMAAVADHWFDVIDTPRTGRVDKVAFSMKFAAALGVPPSPAPSTAAARGTGPQPVGTWPDFNQLIGGFFKFHWLYPQEITVKIDDPSSPLTAMFHGREFVIHDETYTFAQDSFSRKHVHVLTSIDYAKMSAADKAQEPAATARTDGDYALSYIRREGRGRVFYEAHGHDEAIYAMTPMLEHLLAGIQYAIGDLKTDDSPSAK
ncbi:MAG TPA: ThuA domain-containing protein [Vicinamibacterales bacterium]|nr:ThuA domain-containing protein [Vicinamibacterales bacterium]